MPRKEYAHTLAGVASFALDEWKFNHEAYESEANSPDCDTDTMWIHNGRMYAYSDILQQITGKRDLASWEEIVGLMIAGKL